MAKDFEIAALEVDLKNHMHDLIGTHVVGEFWSQIEAWKKYFLLLVEAQDQVIGAHERLLNHELERIAKEEADKAERLFGLGILVFTLVVGPLLSYLSGKIQNTWYPKFRPKVKERVLQITSRRNLGRFESRAIKEIDVDKVHAKIAGDFAGLVVGLGIREGVKVITPNFAKANAALTYAQSSDDMSSFKTQLGTWILEQGIATRDVILDLALQITKDPQWGRKCLARLAETTHGKMNPSTTDKTTLANAAYEMIHKDVNRHRQEWADSWFFYGNNPPVLSFAKLRETLEIEQWALWILNEQLGTKVVTQERSFKGEKYDSPAIEFQGMTFGKRPLPEAVLRKLASFGVLRGRTNGQLVDEASRRGEKLLRRAAEDRDPTTASERNYRLAKRLIEDEEERQDRPGIDIGDALDTEEEFKALEAWAKDHPVKFGQLDQPPGRRVIGKIEDIHRNGWYTQPSLP